MTRTSPGELGEGKDAVLEFGEGEDADVGGAGMAGIEADGTGEVEAGGVPAGSIAAQQTVGTAKEESELEELEFASGKKEAKDGREEELGWRRVGGFESIR